MIRTHWPRSKRNVFAGVLILFICIVGMPFTSGSRTTAQGIPSELTDEQFWKLSSEASEPDGTFRSDNLLSNELYFQYVLTDLLKTTKQGRVYMGVGPEQNFTYIAALKPRMAFIVDIRRGNLDLHLMYKAIFEMSRDRADFVSLLFSRKRPEGLTAQSSVSDIFAAIAPIEPTEELFKANLKAINNHLTTKRKFALSPGDLSGVEYVYGAFYQ